MKRLKIIFLLIALSGMFHSVCLAEPGIRFTRPEDGTTVNPGEDIQVTIEAVDNFQIREGYLISAHGTEWFNVLPVTMFVYIPEESAIEAPIAVIAQGSDAGLVSDKLLLKIRQTAVLTSLEVTPEKIIVFTDWNGNIENGYCSYLNVNGVYSDGITRSLAGDAGTTYLSSDPAVVSIDASGMIEVHRPGEAVITVSNSGLSASIPVNFEGPTGMRPSDTTPPSINSSIEPPANSAGWHNGDVAIRLTAGDNEKGSGVQEIVYEFPYLDAEPVHVAASQAVIPFQTEGINLFRYIAYDNDRNSSGQMSFEIKIDNTPPVTKAVVSPPPDDYGRILSLPATVSFKAVDNLSGVADTTPDKVFTSPGTYKVEYYSKDTAGNIENTKNLTLKIMPPDRTPPKISLKLQPIKMRIGWFKFAKFDVYKFIYSAADDESRVRELKAGLAVPDISGFKTRLVRGRKLEIRIDKSQRTVVIKAPNPNEVLYLINKEKLFLLPYNQTLALELLSPRSNEWTITKEETFITIRAPEIVFEARAVDHANNAAVKRLRY